MKRKLNKVKKAYLKKQNSEQHHAARDAGTTTGEGLQKAYITDKSATEVFTADLGEGVPPVHHIGLCYEFSKAGDAFNATNREYLLQSSLAVEQPVAGCLV